MMFPLVMREEPKEELVNYLEEHGVETRDMLPLTNQPIYKQLLHLNEADYPVSRWVNDSGFYIGCHQDLNSPSTDRLILFVVLNKLLKHFRDQGIFSDGLRNCA